MRGLSAMERTPREPAEPTAGQLAAAARDGDRAAFDQLVERFERPILKTAFFLTRNWHDAEDVAQDVYIKLFSKLHLFKGEERIWGWIYRITVNTARDKLRRRRPWSVLAEWLPGRRQADPVFGMELGSRLTAALNRLSFQERAAFVFQELHEMDTEAVAEVLGCRAVTVRGYLHSARKKLREELHDFREVK